MDCHPSHGRWGPHLGHVNPLECMMRATGAMQAHHGSPCFQWVARNESLEPRASGQRCGWLSARVSWFRQSRDPAIVQGVHCGVHGNHAAHSYGNSRVKPSSKSEEIASTESSVRGTLM